MRFADPIFSNYKRIMMDKVFQQSIVNTFLYLIIQVPIMLILAILLIVLGLNIVFHSVKSYKSSEKNSEKAAV